MIENQSGVEKKHDPAEVAIVIPARMNSKRLPGKPMRVVRGKPMIEWAWRAAESSKLASVRYVVVDHEKIADWCISEDVRYFLDATPRNSGSDRVAAFIKRGLREKDYACLQKVKHIIVLQCDEPDITGEDIDSLIRVIRGKVPMATLSCPYSDKIARVPPIESWPEIVKVVADRFDNALYFSRSAIPGRVHVGVYGYSLATLRSFADSGKNGRGHLEKIEDLEQLRAMEMGTPIRVIDLGRVVHSINTEEELEAYNKR